MRAIIVGPILGWFQTIGSPKNSIVCCELSMIGILRNKIISSWMSVIYYSCS